MRAAIVGFVAGAGWLQMQATLPGFTQLFILMVLAILAGVLVRRFRSAGFKIPLLLISGAIAGFVWAALFAHYYLSRELPRHLEGQDLTIVGTIDSLPYRFERGVRFNFAVERVVSDGIATAALPPRLALSWYSGFRADDTEQVADQVAEIQPGERWQLTVRLRRPHGNANPHGFDYEVWLLEQNLRATGTVRPDQNSLHKNQRLDRFVPGPASMVQRARSALRERIHAALPEHRYASVIVALVIGDQRGIAQSDWDVFNRTGISHLVSISGLHITMIAGLFASAIFGLWRRSFFTHAQLPTILPAQKAAAVAGVAIALLYVLLAGFGVPAQRTLYMLSVVAVALWFGRATSVSHVLCAALALVVLLDPWAVLWPGFWLSFGAVAIIFYGTTSRTAERSARASHQPAQRTEKRQWLRAFKLAGRTQYAVTLGLVPLTVLLFSRVSLIGPLANAIAIPLIGFFVTPLALAGSVLPDPVSQWMLRLAHQLMEWLASGLVWLSSFPGAVWSAPAPSWWAFALAILGGLWLLAPRGWPARWLGLVAWLPLFISAPLHPKEKELWATAFDVGQGTAVLIETERHRLLYDTGPAYSPESDAGSRVIVPYLTARGIDTLDAVMISHSDSDHSGGALSIFESIRVGWTSSSLPEDGSLARAAPQHRRCMAGQSWVWDGVQFEILHPAPVSYQSTKWQPNARSCTLKVSLGQQSILLPGDIGAVQEEELIESDHGKLRASVLLAPHHGSGTSSTSPFLEAVAPEFALFQVGYRNRYRHPKPEVFDRYGSLGIKRLRNDESGAITLRFGSRLEATEYRSAHGRYWYHR